MKKKRNCTNTPICNAKTQFYVCAVAERQSESVIRSEIQRKVKKFTSKLRNAVCH